MDTNIFRFINNLAQHSHSPDRVLVFYAKYGIVLFAVLLLLSFRNARKTNIGEVAKTIWTGSSAIVALGIAQLIGNQVNRPRPYATLDNVHLLIARTTDFSFPSDHATTVAAVAAGLLLLADRRLGLLAGGAALAMAFSRVYAGVHYPTDVLAGLATGAIVAALGARFATPLITRLLSRLTTTPLRALVTVSRDLPTV